MSNELVTYLRKKAAALAREALDINERANEIERTLIPHDAPTQSGLTFPSPGKISRYKAKFLAKKPRFAEFVRKRYNCGIEDLCDNEAQDALSAYVRRHNERHDRQER